MWWLQKREISACSKLSVLLLIRNGGENPMLLSAGEEKYGISLKTNKNVDKVAKSREKQHEW